MTSIADKVRAAANPQQAMLAIAEGLDQLLAQPAQPADAWGEWPANGVSPRPAAARRELVDNTGQIAATEAALATTTDPEDRLALEARLRLLRDTGQALDVGPAAGNRETYEGTEDNGVVVIPPPTPQRKLARLGFVRDTGLAAFSSLPLAEFEDAYCKGGPMWMYAGNRDGVMQMPYALRLAMVEDVALDSDAAAQEMGRDILKVTDPSAASTANLAVALDIADQS